MNNQNASQDLQLNLLQKLLSSLISVIAKLPAPLAYSAIVIIAILSVFLVGGTIDSVLIKVILILFILGFAFYMLVEIFHEIAKTRKKTETMLSESVVTVVVHQDGDRAVPVAGAMVTVGANRIVEQETGRDGATTFSIPRSLIPADKEIAIKARKNDSSQSGKYKLTGNSQTIHIGLLLPATPESKDEQENDLPQLKKCFRLHQVAPEEKEYTFYNEEIRLGRGPESDIPIPDNASNISWEHGLILYSQASYRYLHLSKSNSTTIVNVDGSSRLLRSGRRKSDYILRQQAKIIIGEYEFKVTFDIPGTQEKIYIPTTNNN